MHPLMRELIMLGLNFRVKHQTMQQNIPLTPALEEMHLYCKTGLQVIVNQAIHLNSNTATCIYNCPTSRFIKIRQAAFTRIHRLRMSNIHCRWSQIFSPIRQS